MKKDSSQLHAAALDALVSLREAFPLQQRIEGSPHPVQTAYTRILNHWRVCSSAPPVNIVDPEIRAILVGLDAVVVQIKGLGCYPFSADDRGFTVHYAGNDECVNAFCAIDALAIPRITGRRATAKSRCASCGSVLHVDINADGRLPEQQHAHMRVVWIPGDQTGSHEACCNQVCPNIQFMCATCVSALEAEVFTLPQAVEIGNGFFSFQLQPGIGTYTHFIPGHHP